MNAKKTTLFLLLFCLLLTACGALREGQPTPNAAQIQTTIIRLTPDQIAQAMQADRFFNDYASMTLSVPATVAAVSQQKGDWMIELKTAASTKVLCDVGSQAPTVQAGDAINVQAFSKDVQRSDSGVILGGCKKL